jgi:penicillin-binding protein 2
MDIFGNFSKLKGDKHKRRVAKQGYLNFSYAETAIDPVGKIETKSSHSFFSLKVFVVFLFCVLVFRLFVLQVFEGQANQKLAEGNRIRPRVTEASRGIISDANGNWLAHNVPSFALSVYPSDLPKDKTEREKAYNKIAELSGLSYDEVKKESEKNGLMSLDEIDLKENISHDDALLLEEKIAGMAGVFIAKKPLRQYLSGSGLSHILGYTGIVSEDDMKKSIDYYPSDKTGKTGLEYQYEQYLKGTHGVEQIEVDSKGSVVKVLVEDQNKEPIAGDDIVLNLDLDLQQKTAEILQNGVNKATELLGSEINGGVAMVMDVNTGGILASVSLPSYDNNLFASKISSNDFNNLINAPNHPMFNRAIQGTYPPGSISKIILASAGLQEGNITTNTAFDTPPAITIGDYTFPDNKDHGYTNVTRALAESNNIFFYSVGGGFGPIKGLGIDKIKQYWQKFGLGEQTGIDLPGEASGLLPDSAWKERVKKEPWYIGDTYHVSIGQGDLLVTPIQMLRATATIANGGKLLEPQFVKKIVGPDGNVIKEFGPRIERENFLRPDVIQTVQKGMRMVVTEPTGSAHNLNDLPVTVAGKTGTAQFLNNEKTHAWFECYAPYENPQIAVVVLVDGGGGGFAIASPIAKEILNYYFTRNQ